MRAVMYFQHEIMVHLADEAAAENYAEFKVDANTKIINREMASPDQVIKEAGSHDSNYVDSKIELSQLRVHDWVDIKLDKNHPGLAKTIIKISFPDPRDTRVY